MRNVLFEPFRTSDIVIVGVITDDNIWTRDYIFNVAYTFYFFIGINGIWIWSILHIKPPLRVGFPLSMISRLRGYQVCFTDLISNIIRRRIARFGPTARLFQAGRRRPQALSSHLVSFLPLAYSPSCFLALVSPTSNLLSQPRKIKYTSKSLCHKEKRLY